MIEFNGTTEHHLKLKRALQRLRKDNVTSGLLINKATRYFRSKSDKATTFPHYTTLNRFRDNEVTTARLQDASGIWNFIRDNYPSYIELEVEKPNARSDDAFYREALLFFNIEQQKNTKVVDSICGTFRLYHYSDVLYDYSRRIKNAVVAAELNIHFDKSKKVISAVEHQSYDGRHGPLPMKEHSLGHCLPIGPNICIIFKDKVDQRPTFFVFSQQYDDPVTHKTLWMRGYMLKSLGSESKLLHFYSPIYAVRIGEGEVVDRNIFLLSEIDAKILSSLNQGQVVMYGDDE